MSNLNDNNIPEKPNTVGKGMISTKMILGLVFGLFMMLVYVGMGILMFSGFFDTLYVWSEASPMAWTKWLIGGILIVYGIFRGWRQYKIFTNNEEE